MAKKKKIKVNQVSYTPKAYDALQEAGKLPEGAKLTYGSKLNKASKAKTFAGIRDSFNKEYKRFGSGSKDITGKTVTMRNLKEKSVIARAWITKNPAKAAAVGGGALAAAVIAGSAMSQRKKRKEAEKMARRKMARGG